MTTYTPEKQAEIRQELKLWTDDELRAALHQFAVQEHAAGFEMVRQELRDRRAGWRVITDNER